MDPYPISAFLIPALLLCNALLTAGRTALTVLSDASLKKQAASGDRKAVRIAALLEHPALFLEGCKLAGFACTAVLSILMWPYFLRLFGALFRLLTFDQLAPPIAQAVQLLLSASLIVLTLNVLCLLLPYKAACRHTQGAAFALAGFCRAAASLMRPFVLLNGALASLLARPFGAESADEPERATEEEIRMLVDVGEETGAIESSEKAMINNIFEFDDRSVSEVMTHRTDMTAVPESITISELARLAVETGYSRIPVYEESIDDILGILYVKDLLQFIGSGRTDFSARDFMRPALFVPENVSCVDLLAQFKLKKVQVAVAVDEYGGTAGIVSMEDLLESIVGSIEDEYDEEDTDIARVSEGCYSLDGTVSISEAERLFDAEFGEDSDYDTIGGLLTELLGGLPAPDEHPAVELSGVRFTVALVEERRIARVLAERISES